MMNRFDTSALIGLGIAGIGFCSGLGIIRVPSAIAIPTNSQHDCLTREVWGPEKQQRCRNHTPLNESTDETLDTEVNPLETSLTMNELIDTEWLLEDLNGTGVLDNVQTTLRFAASDRIVGRGGCNRYSGSMTMDGNTLAVGAIGSTKMACPPAVMDQEIRFFTALQAANRIEQEGPYLLVYSEGSEQPLKFTQLAP
ncbi:META domain-containing protein [Leptolyngbya sp. AN02str]|uniref:META domain-containing protein n=1 Tax=Leptolyngbya sp. AN02str TaxID=3423363 RepID=UPI003D315382